MAANRPGAMENKEALSAYEVAFRGLVRYSRCRCHPGAQGPFAESRERNGHGCQRPSCGHGSGPTGKCMPEMPDCDQPRRAFPVRFCVVYSVAAFSSEDGRCHFISVYTKPKPEMRTCRDVPCSNSSCCQSKKGECCVADYSTTLPETKQSRRSAQQRRSGECARVFRVAFRRKLRRARRACVSARFGLLKACESSLNKRSACTMRGAPRLNFAGGAGGCTCGIGIFAV